MTEREEFPTSFATADGVVHAGEKAIRIDGESDWPWFDCGLSSNYAHWIAAAPNCLYCVSGEQRAPAIISASSLPQAKTVWRGTGTWVGPRP